MQIEKTNVRNQKGASLIDFPESFVCIDLETTGLSPEFNEIIEIAAYKVESGETTGKFSTLVRPHLGIDDYITELTGITNEMVSEFSEIDVLLPKLIDFIGELPVVGHNVNFDVNFIYDFYYNITGNYFKNDYIDTMRISRKLFPELKHHRLNDLTELFKINIDGSHRACHDCEATITVFENLRKAAVEKFGTVEDFKKAFKKETKKALDLSSLTAQTEDVDTENPFYGKNICFTGALEKMTRAEAAQVVVNLGATAQNDITKKTDFLILGNLDFCKSIKDGKSSKHKKAESFNLKGSDISIISENIFYEMLICDN